VQNVSLLLALGALVAIIRRANSDFFLVSNIKTIGTRCPSSVCWPSSRRS